jgi:tRNA pseudouridine(55) synthase
LSPTYAGRLDPLASGVLPVVSGLDLELKKSVTAEKKKYVASLLLGVRTDSFDVLGRVEEVSLKKLDSSFIIKCSENLKGKHLLKVPEYSSVSAGFGSLVKNKLAGRENRDVLREMEVKRLKFLDLSVVNRSDVLDILNSVYKTLTGDFRKKVVLESWEQVDPGLEFSLVKIELEVSSGTYVRSLGQFLGQLLDIPACVYALERVLVGEVGRERCIELTVPND